MESMWKEPLDDKALPPRPDLSPEGAANRRVRGGLLLAGHSRRAQQMKGRLDDAAVEDLHGSGGFECLASHPPPVFQQPETVFTVGVDHARRRDAA